MPPSCSRCAHSPIPPFPNKMTQQHAAPWPCSSPCTPPSFETPQRGSSRVPLSSAEGFLDGSWRGAGTLLSGVHCPGSGTPETKGRWEVRGEGSPLCLSSMPQHCQPPTASTACQKAQWGQFQHIPNFLAQVASGAASRDQLKGWGYLAEQHVKVGCVPVGPILGGELQEGSGVGVCLPAATACMEAKMEVEEALGVPGKALDHMVEGGKVWGCSLEEVFLWVQEVGQVLGGQAAEEDHQEPVDRAFHVLPVLWGGEELCAPQQHHL